MSGIAIARQVRARMVLLYPTCMYNCIDATVSATAKICCAVQVDLHCHQMPPKKRAKPKRTRLPRPTRSDQFTMRISPERKAILDQAAAQEGVSLSEFFQRAALARATGAK